MTVTIVANLIFFCLNFCGTVVFTIILTYSWFHIKSTWSVHSFNGDYLSIPSAQVAVGTFFTKSPVEYLVAKVCSLSGGRAPSRSLTPHPFVGDIKNIIINGAKITEQTLKANGQTLKTNGKYWIKKRTHKSRVSNSPYINSWTIYVHTE